MVPKIAAEIAERLLAAGRSDDALGFEQAEVDNSRWVPHEWQAVRLDVLEALARWHRAGREARSRARSVLCASGSLHRACGSKAKTS